MTSPSVVKPAAEYGPKAGGWVDESLYCGFVARAMSEELGGLQLWEREFQFVAAKRPRMADIRSSDAFAYRPALGWSLGDISRIQLEAAVRLLALPVRRAESDREEKFESRLRKPNELRALPD